MGRSEGGGDEMSEKNEGATEYAIKRVGDRYYPVIIDRKAGGHYEIKNPLTGGILSYNNPEAAETYIKRAREKEQKQP
jgi:hypothetical protein